MKLYHFTCRHAAERIGIGRWLTPHTQPQLDGRELVWLTDLDNPARSDIGLTSNILNCDRMEYRITASCEARLWPDYLRDQPRDFRLEARYLVTNGCLPMHWYVSDLPVPVLSLERLP